MGLWSSGVEKHWTKDLGWLILLTTMVGLSIKQSIIGRESTVKASPSKYLTNNELTSKKSTKLLKQT